MSADSPLRTLPLSERICFVAFWLCLLLLAAGVIDLSWTRLFMPEILRWH